MANDPIKFSSPSEDPVSQFCEKSSIERTEVSVFFEGICEKCIRMTIATFDPTQDIEADRPWVFFFSKPSCPCHLLESGNPFFNGRMRAEEGEDPSPS